MKRWLIVVTTLVLLGMTPVVMADRDHHDRDRDWRKEHDRSGDRLRMRVRDDHDRHHRRGNGWHRGHHKQRDRHYDRRHDQRHRHGYGDHHDHDYDRHRRHNGVIIGIGDDRQGLVIWNR